MEIYVHNEHSVLDFHCIYIRRDCCMQWHLPGAVEDFQNINIVT